MVIDFSIHELPAVAEKILSFAGTEKIFLFYGDMGAGKTTLIKTLCHQLGVQGPVSSPTFSIVNEYQAPGGTIFHFDSYRLKTQTEALDMGYEEYFYSGAHCFIEWPEKIPDLLPAHYIHIEVSVTGPDTRQLTAAKI